MARNDSAPAALRTIIISSLGYLGGVLSCYSLLAKKECYYDAAKCGVGQVDHLHHLEDDNVTVEDLMYKYKSDKSRDDHGYTKLYDMLFGPIRLSVTNVTEVGIAAGQSIQAWHRYFPNAEIHGIDRWWWSESVEANLDNLPRFRAHIVNLLKGPSPAERGFLPESMDVVIDDGPHKAKPQIAFLTKLFPLVRPGGYYVIEDISQAMGGVEAFHERPDPEVLPPEAIEILESNEAVWVDASVGLRAWDEWVKRSPRAVRDRTHHNSYVLVIKKRDRPLRPIQMNYGAGAMRIESIVPEKMTEREVVDKNSTPAN